MHSSYLVYIWCVASWHGKSLAQKYEPYIYICQKRKIYVFQTELLIKTPRETLENLRVLQMSLQAIRRLSSLNLRVFQIEALFSCHRVENLPPRSYTDSQPTWHYSWHVISNEFVDFNFPPAG
jgi:hypothetical protein